ncbi:hypothetical protein DSUL_20121 [Desulfovibrionales bacterium]
MHRLSFSNVHYKNTTPSTNATTPPPHFLYSKTNNSLKTIQRVFYSSSLKLLRKPTLYTDLRI